MSTVAATPGFTANAFSGNETSGQDTPKQPLGSPLPEPPPVGALGHERPKHIDKLVVAGNLPKPQTSAAPLNGTLSVGHRVQTTVTGEVSGDANSRVESGTVTWSLPLNDQGSSVGLEARARHRETGTSVSSDFRLRLTADQKFVVDPKTTLTVGVRGTFSYQHSNDSSRQSLGAGVRLSAVHNPSPRWALSAGLTSDYTVTDPSTGSPTDSLATELTLKATHSINPTNPTTRVGVFAQVFNEVKTGPDLNAAVVGIEVTQPIGRDVTVSLKGSVPLGEAIPGSSPPYGGAALTARFTVEL